ncbi:MAG: hypothetical protein EHM44_00760 [Ignavibacteriales bacterium]|nr:MAG: hypothetical protein EHM44_00760 [Ignavibacteriales bacterium]
MKTSEFVKKNFLPMLLLVIMSFFVGCQDDMTVQSTDEITTDQQALQKLADEDSVLMSFEPNYDEGGEMDLYKVNTEIYPFKVGHKTRLVNRTISVTFDGDTAYGLVTKTFEGVLSIKGSYDPNATNPDTLIKKVFTSVVTRNVVFVKIANTKFPERNWKIAAISLPEGGTLNPNIDINKFTAFLPNGDTLVINSPNDYYLVRNWGQWWRWHNVPVIQQGGEVLLRVELNSAYADTDFVTLTFGADRFGMHRSKRKFEMISSNPNGNVFEKVYEQTFVAHQFSGFFHAIINAMPKQVVYDDSTPVEMESWGIPYFVRP